jgi:hypothetical protein
MRGSCEAERTCIYYSPRVARVTRPQATRADQRRLSYDSLKLIPLASSRTTRRRPEEPFRGNPRRRSCPRTTGARRLRTGTDRGTAVSPELNPEPSRCARQPGARPRAEAGTRGSTQRRRVRVQNRAGAASRGLHPEHRSREPSDRPRATPIIRRRPVPGLARTRTSTGHLGHASCAGKWSFTSPHEEVLVWCGNVWAQSDRSEGISFFLINETRLEDFSSGGCFFCITPCAAA